MLSPRRLPGFLLGFLFLVSTAPAKKDTYLEEVSPSLFARDTSCEVLRGELELISIEGNPNFHKQLAFEVTTPPSHGRIEGIRTTGDHTAEVAYRHDGTPAPVSDSFSFRVKSLGRSPSTPAICRISVLPIPARLEFEPGSIDFGTRLIASVTRTNLVIRNVGGSEASGRLILPPGLKVTEGDSFRLGEGDTQSFSLEFSPLEERRYDLPAGTFPSFGEGHLQVTGEGRCRFEISEQGPLHWEIRNISQDSLRIGFSGGEGWRIPSEMEVPPGQSASFALLPLLHVGGEKKIPDHPVLNVSDGYSSRPIELPVPPRFVPVEIRPVDAGDLGSVPAGSVTPIRMLVLNRSEFPKSILWRVRSEHGGGSEKPLSLELNPGESRDLSFPWTPTIPGDATILLSFSENGADDVSLSFTARVMSSPPPADSLSHKSSPPPPASQGTEAPSTHSAEKSPQPVPEISPIPDFVCKAGEWWCNRGSSLVLSWSGSEGDALPILRELVGIPVPSGERGGAPIGVRIEPRVVEGFHPAWRQGTFRAVVRTLSPGWHVMVLEIPSKEGHAAQSSGRFYFRVPEPFSILMVLLKVAGGCLVVFLIAFLIRNRR